MSRLRQLSTLAFMAGLLILAAAAAGMWTRAESSEAAIHVWEFQLTGAEEVPPVSGPGSAFVRLTFDDVTRRLSYDLTVSGLSADQVTAAHIHRGPAGVNGPVIHPLANTGFTQVSGSVTLSEQDVADLRAGNLYVNVHSKANPGGFARAQILLPEAAIRETVERAAAAWNVGDVEGFLAQFSESGIADDFGVSGKAEAREFLGEFIGSPPVKVIGVSNVLVNQTAASAIVDLAFGGALERNAQNFVLEHGRWLLDVSEARNVPVPSGTTVVEMKLQEFAFVYDRNQLGTGNFAFDVTNIGRQDHEVVLVKIAPGVDFLSAIMSESEGPPPGIDVIAQAFWEPGERRNFVLTGPLTNGTYGLVCFIPDVDGVPHAFKGMVSQFSVGTASGGTVRPPSTGDAGLSGRGASYNQALLLAGGLLALAGTLGFACSAGRMPRFPRK